mmetsp:Transcript_22370/g.48146  ORF Transcript_22370/g.48146 Transcript_22370/m.48146 type:complete len:121 (-) Transcript_22370:2278-2640(-)
MGSLRHSSGSTKLQQINSTKLRRKKTIMGNEASRSVTTTRRNTAAPFITLFNLNIFANMLDQAIVNPSENSQGKAMHAAEQTSCDAILSSIESAMIEDAITKTPTQMINRNIGWLALTTR